MDGRIDDDGEAEGEENSEKRRGAVTVCPMSRKGKTPALRPLQALAFLMQLSAIEWPLIGEMAAKHGASPLRALDHSVSPFPASASSAPGGLGIYPRRHSHLVRFAAPLSTSRSLPSSRLISRTFITCPTQPTKCFLLRYQQVRYIRICVGHAATPIPLAFEASQAKEYQ